MKVVCILFIINDEEQVIFDLTEFDTSLNLEFTDKFRLVYVVYLDLSLLFTLKYESIFIGTEDIF
jgi:hypothetical protein